VSHVLQPGSGSSISERGRPAPLSLRVVVVRHGLRACLKAVGLRLVNLPEVVDARHYVEPTKRVDAEVVVVDRKAIFVIRYRADAPAGEPLGTGIRFETLGAAMRSICAERIGPKRAVELMKAGRWQEVLEASEQVEAPLRARLDAWLRGGHYAILKGALRIL
jgi:hypothetical protein